VSSLRTAVKKTKSIKLIQENWFSEKRRIIDEKYGKCVKQNDHKEQEVEETESKRKKGKSDRKKNFKTK